MRVRQDRNKIDNEDDQFNGRKNTRVLLNLPIEYYAPNSEITRPGHTYNVSPDGVMLNIPERLNIGQMINLAIFFSWGASMEAVKVHSQVVWVSEEEMDGSYRSGVRFVDLSEKDKGKLEKFFERD